MCVRVRRTSRRPTPATLLLRGRGHCATAKVRNEGVLMRRCGGAAAVFVPLKNSVDFAYKNRGTRGTPSTGKVYGAIVDVQNVDMTSKISQSVRMRVVLIFAGHLGSIY